jgi:hypothetical protein
MQDTELADRIEEAIVSAGGQTLARHASARGEYDDRYEYDRYEQDSRYAEGIRTPQTQRDETWRKETGDLDYVPDELYEESTLPPN